MSDPSGAAIAKAAVTLTDTNTGINRDTVTNESGIFVYPDLPIGTYKLKISAAGFETGKSSGPDSAYTGQVMDLPIALAVGSQKQEITVTSETQQIETSISTVEQSVTQQQMRDLPLNGRNPLQLTTLTAGTVLTTTGTESGPGRQHRPFSKRPESHAKYLHARRHDLRQSFLRLRADHAEPGCVAGVHHPVVELQRRSLRRGALVQLSTRIRNGSVARIRMGVSSATPSSTAWLLPKTRGLISSRPSS